MCDGLRLVAVVQVRLAETVPGVARSRIGFDVELENADGFLELLGPKELVAQCIELTLLEVPGGVVGHREAAVLPDGRVDAGRLDGDRESLGDRFAAVVCGFDRRHPDRRGDGENTGAHGQG